MANVHGLGRAAVFGAYADAAETHYAVARRLIAVRPAPLGKGAEARADVQADDVIRWTVVDQPPLREQEHPLA